MVLAMAAFALEDMFIKAATVTIPVGQVLLMFGLCGMLVFAALAKYHGDRVFDPSSFSRIMAIRSVCEIMGRLCFTLAIALTPLSNASAILQATPLVVAVGAVAPFRYTRLVFAMIIGVVIFGERPDSLTLIGSAVVVGSGLYTIVRQRRNTATG